MKNKILLYKKILLYSSFGLISQLIFCSLLFAAESTIAQKVVSVKEISIDLKFQASSIISVMEEIENETNYTFVYSKRQLDDNIIINGVYKNISLYEVLMDISRQSNLVFQQFNNNITVKNIRKANVKQLASNVEILQVTTVTGKVTDENGNELPGVNVLVKDTSIGTITDLEGNYSLNVPDDATMLVFSYVGYITEEVDIAGRSTVDFVLTPDIETLSEVVVIGYGTQKRKEVSGAVAQVDGKDLVQAPISTLTNSLTGRLPGLTIDQQSSEPGRESTAILVRGSGTIDIDEDDNINPNGALIVIDGVANVDGLDRLDPNDIESVTVLKDASAAIYGAQAASGVILVTTKRGEAGKPSFNYSFNAGFNSPVSLVDVADGLEYATYINRVGFYNTDWDPGYTPLYSDADIENIRTGTTPTTEWHKSSYKDFFSQTSHNFSVRGGSEKVRYFLSARYFQQGTIFVGDNNGENKQYNIRSNTDFTFGKGLDIGLNIALRQQDVETSAARGPGILVNGIKSSPLIEKFVNGDTRYPAAGRQFLNPVAMLRAGGYERNERRNQSAMLKFNYEIPKINGLAIGGFFSVGMDTDMEKNFLKPWLYYVENASDPNGIPEAHTSGITQLDQRHDRTRILTSNFRTTYKKTIGEKHNLDALLQVEKQEIRTDWFSAGSDNFLSTASDFLGSGSDAREDSFVDGAASELARIGYSGRLNYNYEGKYIAQFLFRYDGSERFAKGQRFGFFPGASLAWVISDEDFLNDSELVSNLKLRASWGQLGNDRIGAFNYLSRFRLGNSTVVDGATVPGIVETGSANPDVTWETTETINLGLEVAFFDNKLNLELDVFDMQTSGILTSPQLTLPQYTGINPPRQNIGQHQNRGFEFAASYRKQKGELSFSIGGNASYTRNKVKFFDEPPFDEAYQSQTGKAWGSPLQYHAIGVFRTQDELDNLPTRPGDRLGKVMIQDTNGDGEITLADRVRTEPGNHDFYYGITTQVTFRNFDLNMLWQGATGGLKTFQSFFSAGNNGLTIVAEESWGPDNPNGTWPTAPRDADDTDFFRLKADYIRLKTLEIGYTLPEDVVSTIGLNNVRVYASAYNLLTFSKILSKYGFSDPEQLDEEARDFPTLKTINLGVNVSF